MIMAAMELRRLDLVPKPAYIVPNHMIDQSSRELLQLYPQARVLVTQRDDLQAGGDASSSPAVRPATGTRSSCPAQRSSASR